jgi:glycosyltransferase involved in cell wall biosynthesis
MLSHPSVRALGQRSDLPELMRESNMLVLPSLEEGFGLVCTEAMGSGCVLLVSDACTDVCQHMYNALVHPVGDVETLAQQITMIDENRGLLEKLRMNGLSMRNQLTWTAAGVRLLNAYRETIGMYRQPPAYQTEAPITA